MLSDARPTPGSVAARAGVSRATASRLLRGSSNVSAAAREAVLRAADEVSRTVNRAAHSLVTRRTESIAFLLPEDEDRMFGDPDFLAVLRGLRDHLAAVHRAMQLGVDVRGYSALWYRDVITANSVPEPR